MRTYLLPLLLLGTSLGAQAADDEYSYAGFELGLTTSPDTRVGADSSGLSLDAGKGSGPIGGLYYGKNYGKWRLEGEYALRRNWYSDINVANAGGLALATGADDAGGLMQSESLMVNAWYELGDTKGWKFFAGMGLGIADLTVDRLRAGKTLIADSSATDLAMQGMLQVAKQLDGGLELGVGVRHFRTVTSSFGTEAGDSNFNFKNNEVFARLTWRFGGDKPQKAAPAPAPMAAPAPAPVATPAVVEEKPMPKPEPVMALPGPFMVFFDWDKSDITPEAAEIIRKAAKAFKEFKAVTIVATGHADRSGPEAYNEKLGMRRAEAVRKALMAEGVSMDAVSVLTKGERSPLVPTADGVREPQNRRTEIVLQR